MFRIVGRVIRSWSSSSSRATSKAELKENFWLVCASHKLLDPNKKKK